MRPPAISSGPPPTWCWGWSATALRAPTRCRSCGGTRSSTTNLGGAAIAVSYCPLTGSGLVYDRVLDGKAITFGTSGLLFDNNLVMYDRTHQESLWSQMGQVIVCDTPREEEEPKLFPVVETSWAAWKQMYPDTTVVTRNTGHDRDYDRYPYGDYDRVDNTQLLYPQTFMDPRLPMKALVHGIVHEGVARAYAFDSLAQQADRIVLNDVINGRPVVVVFDLGTRTVLSFDRRPRVQKKNGKWKSKTLKLELVEATGFPFTVRDTKTQTVFSLTGEPIAGKLVGKIEGGGLQQIPETHTAFWFAWAAFHRDTGLY